MITAAVKTINGVGKKYSDVFFYADAEKGIFIVADGMYGDGLGRKASSTAVDLLAAALKDVQSSISNDLNWVCLHNVISPHNDSSMVEQIVIGLINKAFNEANEKIKELKALGTTVVLAYVCGGNVFIAHAGDSRAYMIRNRSIEQLTEDHSLIAVAIGMGDITEQEAKKSPHKDILTRALGRMNHHPDIKIINWKKGDCFLLTTDGLTDVLGSAEIKDIIDSTNDLRVACDRLTESARSKGAIDDITTVVFRV